MKIINKLILGLFIVTSPLVAEEIKTYKATSTAHPVALIELYTSQGCSSCPPADKWLSTLEKTGLTQDKVIPLALHVDYWDYIGWKDQFAQASFSERQRKFRQLNRSSSVYTPQIIFNGVDVRKASFNSSINQLKKAKAPVKYQLTAKDVGNSLLKVNIDFSQIDKQSKQSHLVLILAENKLQRAIKAGENTGRLLKHEHVVRVWKNLGVLKKENVVTLTVNKSWQRENLELIAFVETSDMQIQQAVRLALK